MDEKEVKELVAQSYNKIAEAYTNEVKTDDNADRLRQIEYISSRVRKEGHILDLGCGAGIPVSAKFVAAGHQVLGIDISGKQIELAKSNVPEATFKCCDIMECSFDEFTFDAVVAFFSIFHLPKEQHPALFQKIAKWLCKGGVFVFCMGMHEGDHTDDDFFGANMYWSQWSDDTTVLILKAAGLVVEGVTVREIEKGNKIDIAGLQFVWFKASKPDTSGDTTQSLVKTQTKLGKTIHILPETETDADEITHVHDAAFKSSEESGLVKNLRKEKNYIQDLSLVVKDEKGTVLAHVMLSPIKIILEGGAGEVPALSLAPLAVVPGHQREGIGKSLVLEALKRASNAGHRICSVYGDPKYYQRFGFYRADLYGIWGKPDDEHPIESFQILSLQPGALDGVKGTVKYSAPFDFEFER